MTVSEHVVRMLIAIIALTVALLLCTQLSVVRALFVAGNVVTCLDVYPWSWRPATKWPPWLS